MDCLIIYCHPYDKSFNHAVLENVGNNLRQNNKDYKLIDLYKDGFVPISKKCACFIPDRHMIL